MREQQQHSPSAAAAEKQQQATTISISSPQPPLSLQDLLESADLLNYLDSLKNVLKLRHSGDICFTDEEDLSGIGMSRPEQKRLFREYAKHFPMDRKGKQRGFGKIKKKFFGGGGKEMPKIKDNGVAKSGIAVDLGEQSPPKMQQKIVENPQQHQQQHIIPMERISLCKEIGSGEFGCVYQAAWRKEGPGKEVIQVAVKRILPEKLISQPASFLQEAAIMTRMHHDNVVRLYGVVLDTKAVMLVSELAPCGSLLECLQSTGWKQQPLSLSTLCEFALQIAKGMAYLAAQRLIHRDLAARNVLVSSPTKVKISDFGLSRSLGHGEDYYRSEFSPSMKLPIAWCAPECINFLRFTSASDVWAYGVTLWEMFSFGQTPWANWTGSQILHAIDTQRRKLEQPEACPAEIYQQIMLNCWHWEAEKRPNFEQICAELPSIFPPILLTVAECRTRREGHLDYGKGQTIVLLDKKTVYPGLWLGAWKGDKVGVFRPEDTIAYLGAENPSAASSSGNGELKNASAEEEIGQKINGMEKKGKILKNKGKEGRGKEKSGEKKQQLTISQPQGDLRHTCHLGADGRSFGLLNVDKNDLYRALPPRLPSPPSQQSPIPIPTQTMMISPLMTASTISLIPPRPPKMGQSSTTMGNGPVADQMLMSRSFCAVETSSRNKNAPHFSPHDSPPPILPPKPPRFRARPNQLLSANSPTNDDSTKSSSELNYIKPIEEREGGGGTSPFPLNGKEQRQRSKSPEEEEFGQNLGQNYGNNGKKEEMEKEEEEEEEEFLRPVSICLEELKEETKEKEEGENGGGEEERIRQILTGLQKDLNEFSINTLEDFSDERALLDGERRREKEEFAGIQRQKAAMDDCLPAIRTSLAISMEPEEFEKRAEEEKRKANKQLGKLGEAEMSSQWPRNLANGAKENGQNGGENAGKMDAENGPGELPRSKKEPIGNWSAEADQAYKLLVQCGHLLKAGPALASMPKAERQSHSPAAQSPLTIQNPLTMNGGGKRQQQSPNSPNQQPPVEYLNSPQQFAGEYVNTAEGNGNVQQFAKMPTMNATLNGTPVQMPKPLNVANGIFQPQKSSKSPPPPVPPKPKIKLLANQQQLDPSNNNFRA